MSNIKRLNVKIIQKHDELSKWNKETETPEKGEIIIYDDLRKMKIGDGVHLPKDLDFFSSAPDGTIFFDNKETNSSYTPINADSFGGVLAGDYIDKTLLKSNRAAEAATTGLEIRSLKNKDTELENKISLLPKDKFQIGLGNVDNTADANKSVKYATTAGNIEWLNVSNRPSFVHLEIPASSWQGSNNWWIAYVSVPSASLLNSVPIMDFDAGWPSNTDNYNLLNEEYNKIIGIFVANEHTLTISSNEKITQTLPIKLMLIK